MEDQFGKYLRLFGTIFFSVIGFIIAFVLLMLGVKLLFGLMSYLPWFTYMYMIIIVLVPAALFISCFIIYFKRTISHPNKPIRYISYAIFTVALISWGIVLVADLSIFIKHAYGTIGMYYSYDMIFLSANVATFFIVGIMQAFTTPKEKDWLEKHRNADEAD
jgi:hypothetical protein